MNVDSRRIREAIHRLRPYFNTATDLGKELDYLFVTAGQYADRLDDLEDPLNDPRGAAPVGVVFVCVTDLVALMSLSELQACQGRGHEIETVDLFRRELDGSYHYAVQTFTGETLWDK